MHCKVLASRCHDPVTVHWTVGCAPCSCTCCCTDAAAMFACNLAVMPSSRALQRCSIRFEGLCILSAWRYQRPCYWPPLAMLLQAPEIACHDFVKDMVCKADLTLKPRKVSAGVLAARTGGVHVTQTLSLRAL